MSDQSAIQGPKPATGQSALNRVLKAVDEATKLTIETVVTAEGGQPRRMTTVIDLIQGDIKNTIPQEFLTGELVQVRAFHEAQVHKGQEIIKNNVDALKSVLELVRDTLSVRDGG